MSIEAMKKALDALETHGAPLLNHEDAYSASLTALRQAIAEAEKQEPDELTIAYMSGFFNGKKKRLRPRWRRREKHDCYLRIDVWSRCVEMVEAKLREKNGC